MIEPKDVQEQVANHIAKARDQVARRGRNMRAQHAARGVGRSSGAVVEKVTLIDELTSELVYTILNDLDHASSTGARMIPQLRDAAKASVLSFVHGLEADQPLFFDFELPMATKLIESDVVPKVEKFFSRHAAGFNRPNASAPPSLSVSVGQVNGGMQVGGAGNVLNSVTITVGDVALKIAAAEQALAGLSLPTEVQEQIADQFTILKSEVAKPEPNASILQASGRTLKRVLEGAAIKAMSDGTVQILVALWIALGMS